MSDDWDEETRLLVLSYCGRDPRRPGDILVEVLDQYDGWSGTLSEFQDLIANAVANIPPEYRASAVVEFGDQDGSAGLSIAYKRPENAEEIAVNVKLALAYAEAKKVRDRAEYERLKDKFGA